MDSEYESFDRTVLVSMIPLKRILLTTQSITRVICPLVRRIGPAQLHAQQKMRSDTDGSVLRMPVPRVHDIPATLHVVASVRALVSHSSATALSRYGTVTPTPSTEHRASLRRTHAGRERTS